MAFTDGEERERPRDNGQLMVFVTQLPCRTDPRSVPVETRCRRRLSAGISHCGINAISDSTFLFALDAFFGLARALSRLAMFLAGVTSHRAVLFQTRDYTINFQSLERAALARDNEKAATRAGMLLSCWNNKVTDASLCCDSRRSKARKLRSLVKTIVFGMDEANLGR